MEIVFNKAWIDVYLNKTDSSQRFFPLTTSGGIRNAVTKRDAPITKEWNAGGKVFIRDAVRTFEGTLSGNAATERQVGLINGFRCNQYGVYIIDRGQNIIGVLSSSTGSCDACSCNSEYKNTGLACSKIMRDPYNLIWVPLYDNAGAQNGILLNDGNYLYPIPVDQDSVYANLVFNDGKNNAQEVNFMFDFVQTFKDETLSMIPCSAFVGFLPSMIRGLIDVCPVFSEVEQTTATFEVATLDGDAVDKTLATGWVLADFSLENNTSGLPVTITSCVENPAKAGEYTITYASQALASELQLTASKTGFGTSCFNTTTAVVGAS